MPRSADIFLLLCCFFSLLQKFLYYLWKKKFVDDLYFFFKKIYKFEQLPCVFINFMILHEIYLLFYTSFYLFYFTFLLAWLFYCMICSYFCFSLLGSSSGKVPPVAVVSPQSRHKTEMCAKTVLSVSSQKDEQDPQDVGSQLSLLKQSSV